MFKKNSSETAKTRAKTQRNISTQSSISNDDFFMEEFSEGEDEDSEVDMGKQPVIRYLISQVRIGMDLTRITLPTFILGKYFFEGLIF